MSITTAELRLLLQYPIAFHRVFSQIGGGVTAGLLLSQLFYMSGKHADDDGWFYHSAKHLQEETTLTRTEFDNARKKLAATGIVEEARRGVPAQLHWRLDLDKLAAVISATSQTGLHETYNLESGEAAPQDEGNPQPLSFKQTQKQINEEDMTDAEYAKHHGAGLPSAARLEFKRAATLRNGRLDRAMYRAMVAGFLGVGD